MPALSQARERGFGLLLQRWRHVRGKSQLDLACDAEVSARHVSFIETGRAAPSREMVLALASALDVPLRERNGLLIAAGFAPVYRESNLDAPELEPARRALDLILDHQEPYPAVVMNRAWDIIDRNRAAARFFSFLLDGPIPEHPNIVRAILDPRGIRPFIGNWFDVAGSLIQRVHKEALGGVVDDATRALLDEVLLHPGVPNAWRTFDPRVAITPFLPITFEKGGLTFRYFSAVTTLGTPQDITLEELRVECFFPADQETAENARRCCSSITSAGTS
jgi:transcriptional regulator with XRE-family HTH domain